jgi:hypothetical protein
VLVLVLPSHRSVAPQSLLSSILIALFPFFSNNSVHSLQPPSFFLRRNQLRLKVFSKTSGLLPFAFCIYLRTYRDIPFIGRIHTFHTNQPPPQPSLARISRPLFFIFAIKAFSHFHTQT